MWVEDPSLDRRLSSLGRLGNDGLSVANSVLPFLLRIKYVFYLYCRLSIVQEYKIHYVSLPMHLWHDTLMPYALMAPTSYK